MRAHLDRCRPCFTHARFEANFLLMPRAGAPLRLPGHAAGGSWASCVPR